MAVEYDLVIIGSSVAGICAAEMAANLNARVALVQQGISSPLASGDRVLTEIGRTIQQVQRAEQLGIWTSPSSASPSLKNLWTQAERWTEAVSSAVEASQSVAVLSSLGVEVIAGCGEFYRKPSLGFTVNDRRLQSRAYLIATGGIFKVPAIEGLQDTGYLTPETVLQVARTPKRFKNLVIIGALAAGIELAQTFSRLGIDVTLVTQEAHILPQADPEAARFVQVQLEAEGIRVLTGTTITQVRQIEDKKWVQAGNRAIAADEILLATEQEPAIASLNLEAANVRCSEQGIVVNEKLQTTNPRIYACTSVNGDFAPHVGIYQAKIAVNNALFWARSRASYRNIPFTLAQPAFATVGLTEPEAIDQYGKNVLILRQPFQTLTQAQIQGETTGFCKFIIHRNGTILGAHLVGSHADELIGIVTLAMRQNLKIRALADLVLPSPSFSEIIHQTAAEWHRLRLTSNTRRQDFLEWFFELRRSWS